MFSHVLVGTNDLQKAKAFYDATFAALGIGPGFMNEDRRIFYRGQGASFGVTKPINGEAACLANGGTVGFACSSPEQVDAWHAAGVANGGASCEDPPGYREGSVGKLYLAYLRDPDGNKLCGLYRPS